MQYYYADGDEQKGPVDLDRLRAAGITPQTLVWREGLGEWQPAGKVAELASLFAAPAAMPVAIQPPGSAGMPYQQPTAGQHQQAYAQAPQHGAAPGAYPAAGQPHNLGYSGYPAGGAYAGGYVAPPSQGMSIASMILGILAIPSTFCYGFGFLLALLAVIFGHIGHSQYKKQTGQANGMAIAGLICGYISLAVVALVFLFVFMILGAAATGR